MKRSDASAFARFCGFGAVGFIVDAGVLTLLVNGFDWNHYTGRLVSFALAVTVTWLLNRTWVFDRTANAQTEYARYFSVQGIGAIINLGTYVGAIEVAPNLAQVPIIPLAIGAVLALGFNFLASKFFVFDQLADTKQGQLNAALAQTMDASYSGRENLEAMRYARNYNRFLEDLVLQHAAPGTALDFGAGAGTFAIPLAQRGLAVDCIEPDADLRAVLEQAKLEAHPDLASVQPSSVDYIYSLNVLEHIKDDRTMLTELVARLKPGGVIMLYVPAFQVLYSSMDSQVGHFRRYRKTALRELVGGAGLTVSAARYVDSLGFIAALVFKWFGNSSGEISPTSVALYDRLAFPLSRLADLLFSPFFGKNLLIVAAKPPAD